MARTHQTSLGSRNAHLPHLPARDADGIFDRRTRRDRKDAQMPGALATGRSGGFPTSDRHRPATLGLGL